MSYSLQPHGLYVARQAPLFMGFSGRNPRVGRLSLSRGSSQLRDWTLVTCIAGKFFSSWATKEVAFITKNNSMKLDEISCTIWSLPKPETLLQPRKKNSCRDFPGGPVVKNLPASAGDMGSIPGLRWSHMPQDT